MFSILSNVDFLNDNYYNTKCKKLKSFFSRLMNRIGQPTHTNECHPLQSRIRRILPAVLYSGLLVAATHIRNIVTTMMTNVFLIQTQRPILHLDPDLNPREESRRRRRRRLFHSKSNASLVIAKKSQKKRKPTPRIWSLEK